MHVRFLSCIGLPVAEDGHDDILGQISGILINPDSAKIEGFFVRIPHFMHDEDLFCSSMDIVRWGTRVYLSRRDVLSPPEERIRIAPLLQDPRTVVGQRIRTESGKKLGTCNDVQFDTEKMRIEWLFPKKYFRWGIAIPTSEILEIQPRAIILRESEIQEEVEELTTHEQEVELPEPAIPTPTTRGRT